MLKEKCGVFGISNHGNASAIVALGLHALQHRGQEGCGIVSFDGKDFHSEKRFGLVGDAFTKKETLDRLPGFSAIGHNRYSTSGGGTLKNIQPFFADLYGGAVSICHNGNLTNARELRKKLVKNGSIFSSTSDTETIVQLIAKSQKINIVDKIIDSLNQIEGAYSLLVMTNSKLIGIRDGLGIRPLVIGKLKNSYILCSETCALDIVGAKFVREVENGEMVIIENDSLKSIKPFPHKPERPCVFEYIYFSRPDSIIKGKTAYEFRKQLGSELAKESDIQDKNAIIVPVPDSGVPAAIGYSQETNKKFELGLIRNHYVGRTFIEPTQHIRDFGVKLKLNPTKSQLRNKVVILIDDSIVRGTTCSKIIKMLFDAEVKEIHVRISCPEIRFPDFYGIDMPTKEELLANNKTTQEICDMLGATSLKFLSLEGLYRGLGYAKRDKASPQLSDHYFTGDYPIEPKDNLENKLIKLSELSAKSTN